jgi:putative transposase
LFRARKRFGLCILNYMVTSNHVHLLVKDLGYGEIPRSMQLVAGRTAQAYNQRKSRKGAFWEDRYHATAVQTGDHLFRCLVYIDLNMVRAGIVRHPQDWPHCGYHEIQQTPERCRIIDQTTLLETCGFGSIAALRSAHEDWISSELKRDTSKHRDPRWTESIAVGQLEYVELYRHRLGCRAAGRQSFELKQGYQLKEVTPLYGRNRR